MHLKILTQSLLLSCFVSCIIAKSVYPGGCYECEEEVWEEVPCDDIPSNSTTTSPPLPCYYTTTPKTPATTMTNPITTTMPTTTTPVTTTTPITTMPITTTTSTPVETTTPKDPYKKCYCECKIGCKEFCRKVIVNPDPKIQVVQVSKITAPNAQGPIEYTHYHQRELLQKPHHHKNYESYSSSEISDEIIDNNDYSTTTRVPPAASYKETILIEPRKYAPVNKKPSYKSNPPKPKILVYTKPETTPATSYPVYETSYHYHQRELLQKPHHHKNYESYSSSEISDEIIDNNDYSHKYSTSTKAPPAASYKETIVIEPRKYAPVNKKPSYKNYPPKPKILVYTKPQTTPAPSYPVYETSYARAEAGSNHAYTPQSKPHAPTQPQPPTKHHTDTASYDFPVPLQKIYTKLTKTIHGSPDNTGPRYTDLTPTHSNPNYQSFGHSQPTYSTQTSLKGSSVHSDVYVRNSLQYDDSFNTLINEFLESNPSNPAHYEEYSSPFYSVSYSR